MSTSSTILKASLLAFSIASVQAAITFNVSFTADAMNDFTPAEQQLFTDGIAFWDNIIDGHQDNGNRTYTLTVDTFSTPASGGSVTLGSAGPSSVFFSGVVAGANTSDERFILAGGGSARFNTHPDAGSLRASTIRHEIGHALGIGTLWEDNEVYNDGNSGTGNRSLVGGIPGEYLGANALAAYQAEFDASATFIPVELSGGSGTAHGHWDESDDSGRSLTGITNASGQDLRDELMTGFASPNEADSFLSETSRQSLIDIGFTLHSIPEPSSSLLLGLGFTALLSGRRRKK